MEAIIHFDIDLENVSQIIDPNKKEYLRHEANFVKLIEAQTRTWCKYIEKALVQFRQLRKEDETMGPDVEITYWRQQLIRFLGIVEFIETKDCIAYIDFLDSIFSPTIKVT